MRPSILILIFLFGFAATDAKKANEAFRNGEYERAAELYQQAIQADPENARLYFNLGNTLARLGHKEEAAEAFETFKSLSDDPAQHAMADYNSGNLYSESEEFEAAVRHYRNALINNPDDPDAIHNYELAMRQLQQQQQEEQQQQDQGGDEEQDQDQNQDQEQNQDGEQDQQQDQNPGQQPEPGADEQEPQQPQAEMNLEEAESILDALEQQERELLRTREKESAEPDRNENDW
ncbi:MAG: tetratricopeptide repeat protein [Balneolaceae bacterium]